MIDPCEELGILSSKGRKEATFGRSTVPVKKPQEGICEPSGIQHVYFALFCFCVAGRRIRVRTRLPRSDYKSRSRNSRAKGSQKACFWSPPRSVGGKGPVRNAVRKSVPPRMNALSLAHLIPHRLGPAPLRTRTNLAKGTPSRSQLDRLIHVISVAILYNLDRINHA